MVAIKNSEIMAVTNAEAKEFVEKKLKIDKLEEKFNQDKLSLLNEIIKAFHEAIPFHNLSLLCLKKHERRQPNETEITSSILSGNGGLCIVNNAGIKNLLQALGYKVMLVPSAVKNEYDHVMILAEIEKMQYVIDVGSGYPTFEAIPLDFDDESKVYKDSFLKYRFVRKDDIIERLHNHSRFIRSQSSITSQENSKLWRRFYHFKVTPVNLSFFDEALYQVYTEPDASPFLMSLRAFRCSSGRAVAICNNFLLTEDDNNDLVGTKLESLEEMKSKLAEFFPMLHLDLINAALDRWEKDIKPSLEEPSTECTVEVHPDDIL